MEAKVPNGDSIPQSGPMTKSYPSSVALTVTDPKTGKETFRWFPVKSPEHEAQLREYVRKQREAIAAMKHRVYSALLLDDFIKYRRRDDGDQRPVDGKGLEADKVVGT
jgi:hypothetical protein